MRSRTRAFHALQAHAVLVLEQFADRADTAVAQMVDVVDVAAAVLEFHQGADAGHDIAPVSEHATSRHVRAPSRSFILTRPTAERS